MKLRRAVGRDTVIPKGDLIWKDTAKLASRYAIQAPFGGKVASLGVPLVSSIPIRSGYPIGSIGVKIPLATRVQDEGFLE